MLEFYLMAIASNISILACILLFVSLLALIILTAIYCTYNKYDEEEKKTTVSVIKKVFICFVLSCIFSIFVPSSDQLVKIYGIGGTIDYIKSNETAKQLPDKCIKALDLYIDSQLKESK